MDNALCGGGDSGAGITDTTVPISASAVKMIKAAILMGDPRYVSGLAYGVGTCTSGGVSLISKMPSMSTQDEHANTTSSSMPEPPALYAPAPARFSFTATPRTHIAATETTPPITSNMLASTATRP